MPDDVEQAQESAENLQCPIERMLNKCIVYEKIFYKIDSMGAFAEGYSLIEVSGYEYYIKMGAEELEKLIDKKRNILINDN